MKTSATTGCSLENEHLLLSLNSSNEKGSNEVEKAILHIYLLIIPLDFSIETLENRSTSNMHKFSTVFVDYPISCF